MRQPVETSVRSRISRFQKAIRRAEPENPPTPYHAEMQTKDLRDLSVVKLDADGKISGYTVWSFAKTAKKAECWSPPAGIGNIAGLIRLNRKPDP